MAVGVKVIRVHLWRLSVLLAGICFKFAQKHPCISGTLLTLFVLYVFFPMVLRLLLYSSPIMVCAYAYRKNVLKSEHPGAWKEKDAQTNGVKCDSVLGKKRNVILSEKIGRIDAEEKNKEYAELHKNPLGAEDETLKKASSESESDIMGKAENDFKKANRKWGKAENAETEDEDWKKSNAESESDILDKAVYEDDETQEEDAQEDTQKAVEWTEQDERNLMDLGTSETERDRRLESLIQKRRARKLLSMQVRKVIDIIRHPPNQVAPLVIARSKGPLSLINTLSDTDDLHMPGSAPSVLLPSRSPFDLPYDPFEERPNLTGDSSFEQEFAMADQKEFCRHESFSLGGHFGPLQDGNSLNSFMDMDKMKGMERHRFSRFRSYTDRGSHETISSGASSVEHKQMDSDDIDVRDSGQDALSSEQLFDQGSSRDKAESENGKNEDEVKCDSDSLNASSCGGPGTERTAEVDSIHSEKYSCDDQVEGRKEDANSNMPSEDLSSYLHKSLGSAMWENAVKESKENGHPQSPVYISSKDLFNVHKRALHTPAHSIASDLVVEISEGGSPPPTLSPPDEDSSQYDRDIDRDISSGSEDISMHMYRMEDRETRSSGGKEGFAHRESIPVAVELEQDAVDGCEHTSATSSDANSSYENVVHHLNKKLTARCLSSKAIMETPEEPSFLTDMSSGVEIGNILSNQTNPMSGVIECSKRNDDNSTFKDHHETSELSGPASEENTAIISEEHIDQELCLDIGASRSRELDGDSNKYNNESIGDIALPIEGQEGTPTSLTDADGINGDTEMRNPSVEVTLPTEHQSPAIEEVPEVNSITLPAEQQNPAIEDVPEITSPKSVLPDTDFKDHITRLDSQPSEVADSLADTTQPESSTRSVAVTQSAQHVENQDLSSKHSESSIEQGNNNIDEAANQVTESDATSNPSSSEDNTEASKIRKADEDAGNEISVSASGHEVVNEHPVSEVGGPIVAEGTKGNHEELDEDKLVTKVDPVEETSNLELTKDEKGPLFMDNQAEFLVGLTSAEALPLSNNLNSDDEFNDLTENYLDFRGSSTAESSEQKVDNDTITLEDPLTASAANNERYEENLDNTSAKSSEPPPKLDSQNEALLPDVDTELHIHRITETCM